MVLLHLSPNIKILATWFALELDLTLSKKVANFSSSQLSNRKQLWRWINSVKGYRRPLPPLQKEDSLITNDYAKATAFNQYFQSVFTNEWLSDLSSLQSSLVTQSSVIDSVSFTPDIEYCPNI